MTEADLRAAWTRWMHRNDIAADLDQVMEYASALVFGRLMYVPDPIPATIDEWVNAMPRMFHHAGLIYLHELAQDDEGQAREQVLFQQASQDHHLARSLFEVDPIMVPEGVNYGL